MLLSAGCNLVQQPEDADAVVCSGGTLLDTLGQDGVGPRVPKLLRLKCPYAIFGMGVAAEPFRGTYQESADSRMNLRSVCEKAVYVGVRDEGSLENLQVVGFTGGSLTYDPTVLLPLLLRQQGMNVVNSNGRSIGISVAAHNPNVLTVLKGRNPERTLDAVRGFLNYADKHGWECVPLCFNIVDIPLLCSLGFALASHVTDPILMCMTISTCRYVVGERMHACLLAAACRTPFLALVYKQVMSAALNSVVPVMPRMSVVGIDENKLIREFARMASEEQVLRSELNLWFLQAELTCAEEFLHMVKVLQQARR